jgi:hypothetical protein
LFSLGLLVRIFDVFCVLRHSEQILTRLLRRCEIHGGRLLAEVLVTLDELILVKVFQLADLYLASLVQHLEGTFVFCAGDLSVGGIDTIEIRVQWLRRTILNHISLNIQDVVLNDEHAAASHQLLIYHFSTCLSHVLTKLQLLPYPLHPRQLISIPKSALKIR